MSCGPLPAPPPPKVGQETLGPVERPMGLGHYPEAPKLLLGGGPFIAAPCQLGISQWVWRGASPFGPRPLLGTPSSSRMAALEPFATARAPEPIVLVLKIGIPRRND